MLFYIRLVSLSKGGEFFPELPAGVFASAFEGADHVFCEWRIFGDGFTDENSRESQVAGVCRVGGAQDAGFKNGFGGEFAADACRNQRVRVERGEVAGIDACDNRLGGGVTESCCHNRELAEIVSFTDFDKRLDAEFLCTFGHLHKLCIVQNSCNQKYRIGTAAISDVNFVFE